MLTREEAFQLLDKYVSSVKKRRHMIAVSAIMKELAKRLGMDKREWELVGLLHDLDYDLITGGLCKHGLVASKILERRLPEKCLHAIRGHDHRTGVKPQSILDKALIASDCVWGLIARVALSVSHGKVDGVKLEALRNTLEGESFPAFLESGIKMCSDFGLTLEDFLKTALRAMPCGLTINEDDF